MVVTINCSNLTISNLVPGNLVVLHNFSCGAHPQFSKTAKQGVAQPPKRNIDTLNNHQNPQITINVPLRPNCVQSYCSQSNCAILLFMGVARI